MATRSNRFGSRRSKPRRAARPVTRATRATTRRRASNGGRPWSAQELTFLRKFYRTQSTSWVARQLGRTVYSVRYKASDLSIKKANPSVWKNNNSNRPAGTTRFAGKTAKAWKATTTRRTSAARKAGSRRSNRTTRTRRAARGRR